MSINKSTLNLRIDWSEMDLFGHVNNVAYFKYVQAGRVNFWEKSKLIDLFTHEQKGPILASTHMDFKKPLHYPGNIMVETQLESTGNTSFVLSHRILNEKNEMCAEAKDIVVMFDFKKNEKMKVPEEFKNMTGE
jgi:acyl-CoA thioester hydrolase